MRSRRVGTLTLGVSLVGAGVMFVVHLFLPSIISYSYIFKLWPVILIFLGVEVLLAYVVNKEEKLKYDGWAVFIMVCMMCLAGAMAGCQVLLDYGIAQGYLNF